MTLDEAYKLAEAVQDIDNVNVKDLRNEKSKRGIPVRGIVILDIDDTLVKANPNVIKCYKSINGKEQALTTAQFATDPDKAKMGKNVIMYDKDPPKEGIAFSIREFRNPEKVYNSITLGTPIVRNLQKMDEYLDKGWDICFLTARGLEGTVTKALQSFLKHKLPSGQFVPVGKQFKTALSAAVNDDDIKYLGADDGEKKANMLRKIASYYNHVVFIDDDARNLNSAEGIHLDNLTVVKAAKLEQTVKNISGENK